MFERTAANPLEFNTKTDDESRIDVPAPPVTAPSATKKKVAKKAKKKKKVLKKKRSMPF